MPEEKTIEEVIKESYVGYHPHKGHVDVAGNSIPPPMTSTADYEAALRELSFATTGLEKTSALKKLEEITKDKLQKLVPETNREFKSLQINNPDKKQFAVNGCIFKSYTKPAVYDYPAEVKQKEQEYKDAQRAAKTAGTAVVRPGTFNPDKDKLFSVSLSPEEEDD